jgi:glycosyltransferase 2 family protein
MAQPVKNGTGSTKEFRLEMLFKPIAIIIPLAIAANIIYILFTTKLHILKDVIDIHPSYLMLAVFLALVPWFTHAARLLLWSGVLAHGLKPIQALKTAMVTDVGSAVTPTSTGGGYFKLGFLIRYGFTPGEAALLTFLGTIEDAIFFAISLPLVIIFSQAWNNQYVRSAINHLVSHWPIVIAILTALVIIYFIIKFGKLGYNKDKSPEAINRPNLIGRVHQKLSNFGQQFTTALQFVIRNGKLTLGVCTLFSGLGWCCRYGAVSALVLGLGYQPDFALFFILQWVIFSAMILIPTPGAMGGAEITFGLVFSGVVPTAILPILIGAWRFVTFYMLAAVGAIFMAITGAGDGISQSNGKDRRVFQEVKA